MPELVTIADENTAFIIGEQVKAFSAPLAGWYDEVLVRRGKYWAGLMLSRDFSGSTPDASDDLTVAHNHYDLPLCLYTAHHRAGDVTLLTLARLVADRWWESLFIGRGDETVVPGDEDAVPGNQKPPPIYSALAGLMLRALDGRPEMWDFLDRKCRGEMDNWVKNRVDNPTLYSDLRDLGYVQLYAVLLAKVLPDSYELFADGTDKPATGQVTDGAARRAAYLADAEDAAVNYFGRLQWPDGSWRWNLWDDSMKDFEQPFMLGIYLEAVVALYQLTQSANVKASLVSQITRACEHLMRDTYRNRCTSYYYPLSFQTWAQDDRHLHTSFIHAFGYAYQWTGDEKFRTWGDELWDSAFGGSDGRHALMDSTYHPKEWTMEARTSSRYLALRQSATTPAPSPAPVPTPAPTPPPTPSPGPAVKIVIVNSEGVSITRAMMPRRGSLQLFAKFYDAGGRETAGTALWSASPSNVATVAAGRVTSKGKAGTVQVFASSVTQPTLRSDALTLTVQ